MYKYVHVHNGICIVPYLVSYSRRFCEAVFDSFVVPHAHEGLRKHRPFEHEHVLHKEGTRKCIIIEIMLEDSISTATHYHSRPSVSMLH